MSARERSVSLRLIDERQGKGKLMRGDKTVHEVSYRIALYQEKTSLRKPSFRRVQGTIALLDGGAFPLEFHDRFVLILEDGAKLDLYVGQGGSIIPIGGLYK